jgi:hypothetical protein
LRPEKTDMGVGPRMYSGISDTNGDFVISEDTSIFALSPGDYTVTAFEYNPETQEKSKLGNSMPFTLQSSMSKQIFGKIDTALNIFLLLFILSGVGVTLLTSSEKNTNK